MSENNGRWWKIIIGPAITLSLVLGGFIAQYATTRAEMLGFKEDVFKVEMKLDTMSAKIHDLELKSAVDGNVLQTVKDDITTIKSDVKALLERANR